MSDAPVGPKRFLTKADVAKEHIQEMIISGEVQGGDRLVTRDLVQVLGMSDTPVREALRMLAAEGWVHLQSHQRAVVATFRTSQLEEAYALRAALGALAIELGGALLTSEQLAEADRILARSEEAVQQGDAETYTTLNRSFHVVLSDTPATEWTCRILRNLTVQSSVVWRGFITAQRMRQSLDEHHAIREAIGRGDLAEAARLHREHEQAAYRAVQRALTQEKSETEGESGGSI